jgi:hypothetical protein
MSSKIEQAIRQLSPDKLRRLEQFAQQLIDEPEQQPGCPSHLQLDWIGKAADEYPEHQSGVEAAHAALDMMRRALDRGASS